MYIYHLIITPMGSLDGNHIFTKTSAETSVKDLSTETSAKTVVAKGSKTPPRRDRTVAAPHASTPRFVVSVNVMMDVNTSVMIALF